MSTSTEKKVPILRAGDRLSADEFERRYQAMPHLTKAELIEGVVYMPSPVTWRDHGSPHLDLGTWVGHYRAHTPGVDGGDNATIRLDPRNRPQPDLALRLLSAHGGRSQISPDGYLVGSPEWAGEVSATSASYDLHDKLQTFQRHGVLEYVVWRVEEEAVDWFVLRDEEFVPLPLSSEGWYKSTVFPGLWLDPAALVARDMLKVLSVLQQGLATPEHAGFVARLGQSSRS